ncbi:hypothetical protein LZC95_08165 [Pendulispora brunnea]|uniref:Uncharacterized protein n=1 Tax=Pendulispora brunnea TaxID=2905690 RepID=A0ABZ2KDP8_9BACT
MSNADDAVERVRETIVDQAERWIENWGNTEVRARSDLRRRLSDLATKVFELGLTEAGRRIQRRLDALAIEEENDRYGGLSKRFAQIANDVPRWARSPGPASKPDSVPRVRRVRAPSVPPPSRRAPLIASEASKEPPASGPPSSRGPKLYPLSALVQSIQGIHQGSSSETYPGATLIGFYPGSRREAPWVLLETRDSLDQVVAYFRRRKAIETGHPGVRGAQAELRYDTGMHWIEVRIVAPPHAPTSIRLSASLKDVDADSGSASPFLPGTMTPEDDAPAADAAESAVTRIRPQK